MGYDRMKYVLTAVLLCLLPLFLAGCGGNSQNAGAIAPPKQNSVDAVLQRQKAAADGQSGQDAKNGGNSAAVPDGGSVVRTRMGTAVADADNSAPVSAQKMKEMEESAPRHDVYDMKPTYTQVDYDFSKMDKNMMYAQIYNMLKTPEEFKGKIVRMEGTFGHYYDEKTGKHYYGCVVVDASACCSAGIEFSRKGAHVYPENYPKPDEPIIVTGRFASYKEGTELFCELADAEVERL